MKSFVTLRNFYLSTFQGRLKSFFDKLIDVNILTPTTFHGEQGYLIFCTVAVPKLDSVVGEKVCLKLLLAKRDSP